jgi:hypothetical protein
LKYNHDLQYEDQMVGLDLQFSEEVQDQEGKFEFAREGKSKLKNFFCHNDLLHKFHLLRAHLALVCEMENKAVKVNLDEPEVLAPGIFATGLVITGTGDGEGMVITGFKLLRGGAKLNLVTPNINLEEYEYGSELLELQADIEREAHKAYDGKRKVVQGSLFDDGDGDFYGDGGADDELEEPTDPKQIVAKMKHDLKKSGVKMTISTGGKTAEF